MPRRVVSFEAPRDVAVRTRPVPSPSADELLVETLASAVSPGTERLVYRGEVPSDIALDENIPALDGDVSYPLQYGYAAVGDVTAVGDDVDDEWRGRRVFAFNPHESHFTARPEDVQGVPGGTSTAAATMLPNVETAVNLVLDARPLVGERVAVFGAGLVGLLVVHLLAAFPLESLVVADPLPARRELARDFGASEAVTPEAVREAFGDESVPGADLAVEVSGNPAALDAAVDVVGYDGRVVVGSWYGTKRADLDLGGHFHRGRVSIESSQVSTLDPPRRGRWTSERRLEVAWERLADLPVDRLDVAEYGVEEAPAAYARLDRDDPDTVGILFRYDA